jgi:hypothetical protein
MKIGKITIPDRWTQSVMTTTYYFKICNHDDGYYYDMMIVHQDGEWGLRFRDFPKIEYDLMYGDDARYWFPDLHDAQDHVDNFLTKLSNLKAFL